MKCLAIGNSITTHGKCSYWWSNAGMAASDELHDYFHIVKNILMIIKIIRKILSTRIIIMFGKCRLLIEMRHSLYWINIWIMIWIW
jgi:hypothetical protein